MSASTTIEPTRTDAVQASKATLRKVASYRLPAELDRRIHELGERKEDLSKEERAELLAWVEFTQQRSIEKLGAELALRQLTAVFPDVAERP